MNTDEPRTAAHSETTWTKIAHSILRDGARWSSSTQADQFGRVRGRDGKTPVYNTVKKAVRDHESSGFFAHGPLRFGPGAGLTLAASLGSESLRVAVIDANGEIAVRSSRLEQPAEGAHPDLHCREAAPMPRQLQAPRDQLMTRIAGCVQSVADEAVADQQLLVHNRLPLLGVALAWPTPIRRATKIPCGLGLDGSSWDDDVGLVELLAERFGLPADRCHALNDANAVALSVAFDHIRHEPNLPPGRIGGTAVALRIGGGLGAGTVIYGTEQSSHRSRFLHARLLEGADGYAGEIGHLQVSPKEVAAVCAGAPSGLKRMPKIPCSCGRRGCLETYASATAFASRMLASGIAVDGLHPREGRGFTGVMHEAMRRVHREEQLRAQRDIGRLIGRSLSPLILMLNPDSVTLSGSMAVERVRQGVEMERDLWQSPYQDERDILAPLLRVHDNKFAAARGAALAAFRGRLYRRLDELGTTALPFHKLTIGLGRTDVAAWDAMRHGPE